MFTPIRAVEPDEALGGDQESNKTEKTLQCYQKRNHELKLQVDGLTARVADMQTQILRLQPYQGGLSRDEAVKQYTGLCDSINSWVQNATDRFTDKPKDREGRLKDVEDSPRLMQEFRQILSLPNFRDIALAIDARSEHDGVEQWLLTSLITRYVVFNILSASMSPRCSARPDIVRVLDDTEKAMKAMKDHDQSKPDILAISAWKAQGYHACFSVPEHTREREVWAKSLVDDLNCILRFACVSGEEVIFQEAIFSKIVKPAVLLREQFDTSTDDFYFEGNDKIKAASYLDGSTPGTAMYELVNNIEGINVARSHARFGLDTVQASGSDGKIFLENFYMLCSLSPALMVREPLRENEFKQSFTLVKERVLIEWDVDDAKKASSESTMTPTSNIPTSTIPTSTSTAGAKTAPPPPPPLSQTKTWLADIYRICSSRRDFTTKKD